MIPMRQFVFGCDVKCVAETLEMDETDVRVIQPHVGGAFGLKQPPFQEQPLLDRPDDVLRVVPRNRAERRRQARRT